MTVFEQAISQTKLNIFKSKVPAKQRALLFRALTELARSASVGPDDAIKNAPFVDGKLYKEVRSRKNKNV